MNDQQKANEYGNLLNEHTKLFNEISLLKSENMDSDPNKVKKIMFLERKQAEIMERIKRLFG